MRGGRCRAARAAVALGVLLAACQPLPHPFADDRPPASLLRLRDTPGVSVAPVEGAPAAVAAKLGAATARALLKQEIPASDKTTSLGSYHLYGRVVERRAEQDKSAVTVYWRLYDARGRALGERSVRLDPEDAQPRPPEEAVVAKLAALSATALLPLLAEEPTAQRPGPAEASAQTRVAIGKIVGAPGDGATSLASALGAVLRHEKVAVVEPAAKPDLYLDGEVAVTPAGSSKQHVKIRWRVRRADGSEIGTVGQENDIPAGQLDAAWGDIAYSIAVAAGEGLMQLLAQGAAPKS